MGLPELASAIRGSIQDKNTFNLQKASRISARLDTLPVDKETKFDLADVTQPSSEIQLPLLKDSTLKKIKEFLTFTERAKELKDAGLGVTSSMILYGPPGCGKTLTSKYIASCLNLPLLTARCDSLVSSYLGSTSKNIRQLFEYASKAPCVLFLDELDSLATAGDDQDDLGELSSGLNCSFIEQCCLKSGRNARAFKC
ncbi:ATP-binding protein [Escherichia marmotae]|nr:ATP-binding protein [Escherichia marmotae]